MVLIPFCKLLLVRESWLPQGIQEQMRSPKLSPNHKKRIKTILDQFRNKHARSIGQASKLQSLSKVDLSGISKTTDSSPNHSCFPGSLTSVIGEDCLYQSHMYSCQENIGTYKGVRGNE